MDTTDAPQIIEHVHESLTFTPYDTKWIPLSARPVINQFCGCTHNERNIPPPLLSPNSLAGADDAPALTGISLYVFAR